MKDILSALELYTHQRIPTGSFLRGCLENNLYMAVSHADFQNQRRIPEVMATIRRVVPEKAWGSKERVEAWLKNHES